MLLQVVFLWLAACLQVLALNAATPWETMYFYSVYKAELAAGVSTKTTGGGCVHSASNFPAGEDNYKTEIAAAGFTAGICTYDEFVKFIGDSQGWADYKYTTDGATINPDWAKIKAKLESSTVKITTGKSKGNPKPYMHDVARLLTQVTSTKVLPMPVIMKTISDGMQTARAAFAALEGVSNELTTSFTKAVDDARTHLKIAQQIRVADAARYLNTAAAGYISGTPFATTSVQQDILAPDGTTVLQTWTDEANYDAMLAAAPTATDDDKKNLKRKFDDYGTDADITSTDNAPTRKIKKLARNHKNTNTAFKQATDILEADIKACTPPAKKKRGVLALLDRFRSKVRRQNQRHLTKLDLGLVLVS
ncbi:hypothetical protein BP6252_12095 [Coleophoma cylindrospora]|uniref:Uncharacterized protein n=1 Tax=Coleophoma cylindrospora TaxID=1849047 RepID=A0A3D8QFV7_9HELO|nr:hypothetical protein BP6252_12095 [Coleophoma cylindrospora]